jgi:hypothetical protein
VHARLREGAQRTAREFSLSDHIARLTDLFTQVTATAASASPAIRAHLAG